MTNITLTDRISFGNNQALISDIAQVSDGEIRKGLNGSGSANPIISLASQPGVMESMLNGQSLMADRIASQPSLSAPLSFSDKLNSEQQDSLIKLAGSMKGGDITKLEQAAASAATLFGVQHLAANRSTDIFKPAANTLLTPAEGISQKQQSHAALEGGTDITAVSDHQPRYSNLMGDMKMLQVNDLISKAFTESEIFASKASASAALRAVDSAARSGNQGIESERSRVRGSIAAASVTLTFGGASTVATARGLNKESQSITNNLNEQSKGNGNTSFHNNFVQSSTNSELNTKVAGSKEMGVLGKKGSDIDNIQETLLNSSGSIDQLNVEKEHRHMKQRIDTQKTKTVADYGNQIAQSTQGIISGGFNVDAATHTSEAGMARADQSLNNEIASNHQQTAKKAADAKASLQQIFDSARNNNNNTASSIIDHMSK